jgi:hypothetical protein
MSVTRRQLLSTTLRHALAAIAVAAVLSPAAVLADSTATNTQSASAEAGFPFTPPRGSFIYTITRDGEPIGTQRLDFISEGSNRLTVITDVNIDVRMLGLSFYKFTQHIEEHWVNGKLQAMLSNTNDDGEERKVDLKREGDRLQGSYNEKKRDVPADLIPSTLWHPDAIAQDTVLDTVRARTHQVTVTDKGRVALVLPSGQFDARRYSFTGELNRDVWYGTDGIILQAEMKAKDGSIIRQQLLDRP